MNEELLPCPFCNGEPKWFDECSGIRTIMYCIECSQCTCQTAWVSCKDTVRQLWNTRPNGSVKNE